MKVTDRFYHIKKCIYWDKNIGNYESWQIEDSNGNPLFWPNVWLRSLRNQTVRQYAYKLRAFLEYLAEKGKTYLEANSRDLSQFLNCLRFRNSDGIYTINESAVSYSTITSYVAAISSFYRNVATFRDDIDMQMVDTSKPVNRNSYLYHIAWTKETKKILVERFMDRYQPKREYEKWYTDEEVTTDRVESGLFRPIDLRPMTLHANDKMFNESYHYKTCEQIVKHSHDIMEKMTNETVLFRGKIVNSTDDRAFDYFLKRPFAFSLNGMGICVDSRECSKDKFACLACQYFIPNCDDLLYFKEQLEEWKHKLIVAEKIGNEYYCENVKYNISLFQKVIEKIENQIKKSTGEGSNE